MTNHNYKMDGNNKNQSGNRLNNNGNNHVNNNGNSNVNELAIKSQMSTLLQELHHIEAARKQRWKFLWVVILIAILTLNTLCNVYFFFSIQEINNSCECASNGSSNAFTTATMVPIAISTNTPSSHPSGTPSVSPTDPSMTPSFEPSATYQ